MIVRYYSVYDKAVGAYLPPFAARQKMEAIRSFADAVGDDKHQFNRHADDYVLFELGEFDDASGRFSSVEPVRVISALECLTEQLRPSESVDQVKTRGS